MSSNYSNFTSTLFLYTFLCMSCSPKIISLKGNHDELEVFINKKHQKRYVLKTAGGTRLSSSLPSRFGKLRFYFSDNLNVNPSLLKIYNHNGKVVNFRKSDISTFRNIIWEDYLEKKVDYTQTMALIDKYQFVNNRLSHFISKEKKKLKSNDAYARGRCSRPETGRLPSKPSTACSYSDAKKIGTAICLASTGSSEACSYFAGQIGRKLDVNVRSFISSPACSYMVAQYQNQPYTVDNFVGDLVLGIGEDIAKNALKSNSFWDNVFGAVVGTMVLSEKVDRFNSCVSRASNKCRAEYRRWQTRKSEILNRPEKVLNTCNRYFNNVNFFEGVNDIGRKSLKYHESKLVEINGEIARIQRRGSKKIYKTSIPPRTSSRLRELPVNTRSSLGFQGKNLASFKYDGKTYSDGVKVISISNKDLPAYKAGLKYGDVIYDIDKEKVKSMAQIRRKVQLNPNKSIKLSMVRDGKLLYTYIKPEKVRYIIGVTIKEVPFGMRITNVTSGDLAYKAGVSVGDVIMMADNKPIEANNDLQDYLTKKGGTPVRLMIKRGRDVKFITVSPRAVKL